MLPSGKVHSYLAIATACTCTYSVAIYSIATEKTCIYVCWVSQCAYSYIAIYPQIYGHEVITILLLLLLLLPLMCKNLYTEYVYKMCM